MKKVLICCAAVAFLLCGCSSNVGVGTLNNWKPWVAVTVAQPQLYDYFQKTECGKGDISSLFYEDQKTEKISMWNDNNREITDDLGDLAEAVYDKLAEMTKAKYIELVSESYYPDDEKIIMNVINDFLKKEVKSLKSDGSWVYPVHSYYYRIDWLFEEENWNLLSRDIMGLCGKFSEFRRFVNNSTTVFSSQLVQKDSKYKLYEAIYYISFGDVNKYAVCRVLDNKKGPGEIRVIDKSDYLMDLLEE